MVFDLIEKSSHALLTPPLLALGPASTPDQLIFSVVPMVLGPRFAMSLAGMVILRRIASWMDSSALPLSCMSDLASVVFFVPVGSKGTHAAMAIPTGLSVALA